MKFEMEFELEEDSIDAMIWALDGGSGYGEKMLREDLSLLLRTFFYSHLYNFFDIQSHKVTGGNDYESY